MEVHIVESGERPSVSGPVRLIAPDGHEIARPDQFAMCRRGGSHNKPSGDGTHVTNDFDGTLAK
jgi:CDGSH-type Zn-finger protein